MNASPLLDVRDLTTVFPVQGIDVPALRGVDLTCRSGERIGIVGESGSGKSVLARSILNLVRRPGRIAKGQVLFDGADILEMSEAGLGRVRGRGISLIFQDAGGSLTPVYSIGDQMIEVMRAHLDLGKAEATDRAILLLRDVGIPEPERRMSALPGELSGGMKQRVAIAMALCSEPRLLIADDPTSAVDVTIQAQILKLLYRLVEERDLALIFISHDLRVVSTICDRLLIMYNGSIVEEGRTGDVVREPHHPYTEALLACAPSIDSYRFPFATLPGTPPSPRESIMPGCSFFPRCSNSSARCSIDRPALTHHHEDRGVACWFPLNCALPKTRRTTAVQ